MITGLRTLSCNCTPGWSGPTCSDVDDNDFCASQPCLNGGTCLDTGDGYSCHCIGTDTGPSGNNCTDGVDECQQTNSCQNWKHCNNSDGSYNCSCAPFYTGANCETLMPCTFNPCENGTTSLPSASPPPIVHMPVSIIIYSTIPAAIGVLLLLLLLSLILIVTAVCFVKKR